MVFHLLVLERLHLLEFLFYLVVVFCLVKLLLVCLVPQARVNAVVANGLVVEIYLAMPGEPLWYIVERFLDRELAWEHVYKPDGLCHGGVPGSVYIYLFHINTV